MTIVLFDLDGVLVDNIRFEEEVTAIILRELASQRGISAGAANNLWYQTLEEHRHHVRWHEYGLHCDALGLGEFWQHAHEAAVDLLTSYPEAYEALAVAEQIGPAWIASDASDWVVEFKLRSIALSGRFEEVFSVTRCHSHKGTERFWRQVAARLPDTRTPVVFIDNRLDRIKVAQRTLSSCIGIWLDEDDHSSRIGFGRPAEKTHHGNVPRSTHKDLSDRLRQLVRTLPTPQPLELD